ncbi:alpha amylase catalytic region [Gloeothece citriformis PCC 7424]|uniref:Alpha amylase catalytic region n=1 Tax=Gloeothece citriformis (strain PCC 7424) TaxID=65393 RepID=B7KKH1_GLOC7|nr:alpha-amylase family protein [Gloeothece citriformis]ACK72304.1 alpha amylase catalytic region [Gloeothece citriformis PCC 7424]
MIMQNIWHKNAIIYSLDVETFMDSNGDGVGDFQGLIERLDYLSGLGINCLWLLPFYPSPNRDNGYDVMDYYNVDPRLGTLGDFVEFMDRAREQGIHVLIDLVVNHTSIEHPWFQAARTDKNSKYRHYYVWSENPPQDDVEEIVFPHAEDSIWEYDQQAEAYYLHHFYKEQPDLNIANSEVREEIRKIINFWLQLGVSGFRVDAVPYLIKEIGVQAERHELESFLSEMREFLSLRRADAVLLAEANVSPDLTCVYFGQGDRMNMLFNFYLNQQMFLALARQEANPIIDALKSLPKIPKQAQWLNFVRHHDELNLNQLENTQREEIFQVFAPEEAMQIYKGRGIRRRLPPMFGGDRRRIELTYSLLFSLPGIPLLRYGDEIGMGDDLSLSDRDSVRTPMQWSSGQNGGFSTSDPEKLTQPMISQGEYSYKSVNVAASQRDPNSLLNWMDRLIRIRKQCSELGWGNWQILDTGEPCVFAHSCEWNNKTVIAVHNLADKSCSIALKLDGSYYLDDLFGDHQYEVPGESHTISLEAYGYRWFRLNPIKP